MKNVLLDNELVFDLTKNKPYLLIDALYLDSLTTDLEGNKEMDIITRVRKSFPDSKTPFAIFLPHEDQWKVSKISAINHSEVFAEQETAFSTDTNLLIIISISILEEFLSMYSYGDLVDDTNELISLDYWDKIAAKFDSNDIGILYLTGEIFPLGAVYRINE